MVWTRLQFVQWRGEFYLGWSRVQTHGKPATRRTAQRTLLVVLPRHNGTSTRQISTTNHSKVTPFLTRCLNTTLVTKSARGFINVSTSKTSSCSNNQRLFKDQYLAHVKRHGDGFGHYLSVQNTTTFNSLHVESFFWSGVHLQGICIKFLHEGHRVKVIESRSRSQEQTSVSVGAAQTVNFECLDLECSFSSHQTHYRSYQGRVFWSSKCAYDCAQLQYIIQHRTVLIISPRTSRQTS